MAILKPAALPRLVIGAPQGRSGKTTISLGLCAALSARGLAVQPFKKGPDYIDPSWLTEAAGRSCRSLDSFFLDSDDAVRKAFWQGARQADIGLVEGNHGLYDSLEPDGQGSTAAVARALQAPVLLVVNAARMSRSAAAMVRGYQTFEPDTPVAGVVLNSVSNGRHEAKLRTSIETYCGIPVVGAFPRDAALTIPDRYLGLVPRAEEERLTGAIEACRQAAERYLDLSAVLSIARSAPPFDQGDLKPSGREAPPADVENLPRVRVGVIRDKAFTFYYPENLEALVAAGAQLVFIDSFRDARLPAVDGLYIGGGFPEIFLEELAANRSLQQDIREAVEAGLPIYAECGGLMYLARRIHWGGQSAEMAGVLPLEVEMTEKPQGHGYVEAVAAHPNPFFPPGTILRGHEFHHSRLVSGLENLTTAYRLQRGSGLGQKVDGVVYRNVLAAYTHLHAGGAPLWATGLVRRAAEWAKLTGRVGCS